MVAGSLMAIIWTWLGKPWGVHGFISGSMVSLIVLVIASIFSGKRSVPEVISDQSW
jgi:hypothetical protein